MPNGSRPSLKMGVVTFTTDFGQDDWFVGTMKGVVLAINPKARLVDITHSVPPGDIRAGAFALAAGYQFFPRGTIHVAVVDPGVGSKRRAIALWTPDYVFVGPDNGVLSWAVRNERVVSVRQLEDKSLFRRPVSRTFHGRDVFAPVAAHLSNGVPPSKVGRLLKSFEILEWSKPRGSDVSVRGEIVYVDRFGNCITNIDSEALRKLHARRLTVLQGRRRLCAMASSYSAVHRGCVVAVIGSSGFVEVAVNSGNASRELGLKTGMVVTISGALS